MADVATDIYDREFNLSLASNEREILMKVDSALERIENGEYTVCNGCGCDIPAGRLKVMPYTSLCVKCASREDDRGRH